MEFSWKESLEEGVVPVSNYRCGIKEFTKSEQEKLPKKDDFKVVEEKFQKGSKEFAAKMILYHQKHQYVVVKKFDKEKQTYICKIKKSGSSDKEQEEVECKFDELSEYIDVMLIEMKEEGKTVMNLHANVNAEIIDSIRKLGNKMANVLLRGKIVNSKDTFA